MAILNQYPLPNNPQVAGPQLQLHDDAAGAEHAVVHADRSGWTTRCRRTCARPGSSAARARASCTGFTVTARAQRALPGFTDSIQKFPLSFNTSGTVNYTMNNTTFLEATYGVNQNRLGTPSIGPFSNRNNVDLPGGPRGAGRQLHARRASRSCSRTPGVVDPGYYEYGALAADRHAVLRERPHPAAAAAQLGRHAHRHGPAQPELSRAG